MAHPGNVLFVCTGNQCRSAAAEAILRKQAHEAGLDMVVRSAGTLTNLRASPAQADTIRAAAEQGYDLREHASQTVTDALLREADLVLGMAREHLWRLARSHPHASARLFKPYCQDREPAGPEGDDIPDPVGEPIEVHRACVREISRCIEQLISRWKGETGRAATRS